MILLRELKQVYEPIRLENHAELGNILNAVSEWAGIKLDNQWSLTRTDLVVDFERLANDDPMLMHVYVKGSEYRVDIDNVTCTCMELSVFHLLLFLCLNTIIRRFKPHL